MPGQIDHESMDVDELPGIWSPVQWQLSREEHAHELEQQATASLLWVVDVPEAILRLLLKETDVEQAYEPPKGFDPEKQGEWIDAQLTFAFKRPIRLVQATRTLKSLVVEFDFGEAGYWAMEIEREKVVIERV